MRHLLLAVSLSLVACSSSGSNRTSGTPGPEGPTGLEGPPGVQGPKGDTGAKGDKGDPGQVTVLDGGTIQGPTGPTGAQGPAGMQGPAGAAGPMGLPGGPGPAGPQGPAGAMGPAGPIGPAGAMGAAGPAGPAATLMAVANGDATCPYGGTQITAGGSTSYACNGAPGSGGSPTYNGGIPPVSFAGYTPTAYAGNLNGRSGAHALCDAAFAGSHFCTTWEVDQATPPPVAGSAWVDNGDPTLETRNFRLPYSTQDSGTCGGWTESSPTAKPDGNNLGRAQVFTSQGGIASSFVSLGDGGCGTARPLACCKGGTAVRFRGFTPTTTGGNLGGRSGAHATCNAAFAGSHFCTTWEVDQAAVKAPIPASSAWVDNGDPGPNTRNFRLSYSAQDSGTCGGWTESSPTAKPDGNNLGRAQVFTPLGGIASSFVSLSDGGCGTPRPLACCDGYPPQ